MNPVDIVVIAVLVVVMALCIRNIIKAKKNGGCCGNCSSCGCGCTDSCSTDSKEKKSTLPHK